MVEKILIIEDELPNAQRLQRMIKLLRPNATILSIEDSINASVAWLQKNAMPEVIMMDVRLSDGLSFEIFNQIEIACPVIFTTAYDEYAVQAFKYNGLDYLLKPIQEAELLQAFEKLEKQIQSITSKLDVNSLLDVMRQLQQGKEYRTRFLLPFRDSYQTLLVEDIAYFFTDMGGNRAMLMDGTSVPITLTLETLEKQLDPKRFFRANRQFIVHIDAIKTIHNYFNGKLKVELKNATQEEVIISREKAAAFKEWLNF